MAIKGGYRILDLKMHSFTSDVPEIFDGAYAAARNQYNKAILVSGMVVNDVRYPDFYANFADDDGVARATVQVGVEVINIGIGDGNEVTITLN